ncbi:MAG TPA: ArsR family transcriptional regulator [Chthoniobacterales bacterium]|nr:ArsR family transcriptional regulator [Chthoniobacterales bacterium]
MKPTTPWSERFLASTRGKLITLLRTGQRTVNDLAEGLGLTDNAVRAHLVSLERDGLVRASGHRPGLRKPHVVYELTPATEHLFPKSYGPLLNQLLTVLEENSSPKEVERLLREVGVRAASAQPAERRELSLSERIERGVGVLGELGGMARIEKVKGDLFVRGYGCPLAAVVKDHPEACRLAESLLTEVIGAPVKERCDREGTPQCLFQVMAKVA